MVLKAIPNQTVIKSEEFINFSFPLNINYNISYRKSKKNKKQKQKSSAKEVVKEATPMNVEMENMEMKKEMPNSDMKVMTSVIAVPVSSEARSNNEATNNTNVEQKSQETVRFTSTDSKTKKTKKRKNSTRVQPAQKQTNSTIKEKDNSQAKATLYGLSSLKRKGNVKVNRMTDYTAVKSNFLLGPLTLKVEKTFGKNEKRDIRIANAQTSTMIGRINIRVVNGIANLHSIKVQQPKQVLLQLLVSLVIFLTNFFL